MEGQQSQESLRQIRQILEEATGFASYKAYASSFFRDWLYVSRSYKEILESCSADFDEGRPGVDIVDVSNEDCFLLE